MIDLLMLCVFLGILIIVSTMVYLSLQRVDYSKLFKANSTVQIRILIFVFSLIAGFIFATGVIKIYELICNL